MKKQRPYSKTIVVLVLYCGCHVLSPAMSQGATYHVDATYGNDGNDGLSPEEAWRTLARASEHGLRPGDFLLLKRGEVWREEFTVPLSGGADEPITVGAYGAGARPEIDGADVITGWDHYGNNVYVAEIRSEAKQLFVDGQRQTRARWPNRGWRDIDRDSNSNNSLYSTSLTQQKDHWAGATLVIKTQLYWIETRLVIASSEHTILWDEALDYGTPRAGYGFYLEGKVSEIDMPGEWCYDSGKVYLMLAEGDDPSHHVIEGSVRDYGIRILNRKYVEVKAIALKCHGVSGMSITAPDQVYVKDCDILFPKVCGIEVYTPDDFVGDTHFRVEDSHIGHAGETGIHVWGGASCEIIDNDLTDTASDEASPKWGNAVWIGDADHAIVAENSIDGVSYIGIYADAKSAVVSRNTISNCLLFVGDGGGIYTAGDHTDFHVTNNVVSNVLGNLEGTPYSGQVGTGVGIYLDEISSGYTVTGNIVYGCDLGLHLHNAYRNTVANNVVYDNRSAGIELLENGVNRSFMHDNNLYNNIFVCAGPKQLALLEDSEYASPGTMGRYDYNVYFSPYRDDVIAYAREWGEKRTFRLDAWQTFSGQDVHSAAQDPRLVDTAGRDFRLRSESPCIDAGVDVGVEKDFDGVAIPQGASPDIGAYEYHSTFLQHVGRLRKSSRGRTGRDVLEITRIDGKDGFPVPGE